MRDVILGIRNKIKSRNLDDSESLQAWDAAWEDPKVSERWLDQFAHPNERSYNLKELSEFLHGAGLELVEAFSLGRPDPRLVPPEWSDHLSTLDINTRSRLMELLNPRPTSPFIAARRIRTTT